MLFKFIIPYKGNVYRITCTERSTYIEKSYRCKSIADMKMVIRLCRAKGLMPHMAIQTRTTAGMVIEWRAHNLLYALGICPSWSQSADLKSSRKWYAKIGYFALSCLYLRY